MRLFNFPQAVFVNRGKMLHIVNSKIIEFLDVIHCPVVYLRHSVLETGFCLHPQVKAYSIWPNPCLWI
jgi:hypothetical protein